MTNITHYVIILVYLDRYIVIFFRGLFHGFYLGRIVKLSAHLSHKKLHKVFSSLDIFVVCCLIYFPIPE